ncbi:hypothetical protein OPQ81_001663 [Rhizoctonia solani]|nr:hypothetical protein OPQ81_001663 [Rhizoctonia solani]
MHPLTLLTHKDQPFVWEKQQAHPFQAIKEAISKEPVLIHPDESKPYFLETDASGAAMGAVLSQRGGDGHLHHVAFISKIYQPAEMNYDPHDKELLAIIHAFEQWRMFLEGTEQPITVFTDHRHLEYWQTARTFNRRHACWSLILASYNFVICYRPENSHKNMMTCQDALITLLWNPRHKSCFLNPSSKEDPSLDIVMTTLLVASRMPHSIAQKFKDYTLQEGLLFYQGRMVVPDEPELKQELLAHFHDSPAAGHH